MAWSYLSEPIGQEDKRDDGAKGSWDFGQSLVPGGLVPSKAWGSDIRAPESRSPVDDLFDRKLILKRKTDRLLAPEDLRNSSGVILRVYDA